MRWCWWIPSDHASKLIKVVDVSMEAFFSWLERVDPAWIYLILGCSAYLENILPPTPGDTVLLFGAYLVGRGLIGMEATFVVTTISSVAGFMTCFAAGRWLDRRFVQRYLGHLISERKYHQVERWFQRYGYWVVAANRFLAGMRSVVGVAAGLSGLRLRFVIPLVLVSAAVWNAVLLAFGAGIGSNWETVAGYLQEYNRIVVITLLTVLTAVFLWYILRNNNHADNEQASTDSHE